MHAWIHEGDVPSTYLGVPTQQILSGIGLSMDKFAAICDEFTNRDLFVCDDDGALHKDRDGNLVKVSYPSYVPWFEYH